MEKRIREAFVKIADEIHNSCFSIDPDVLFQEEDIYFAILEEGTFLYSLYMKLVQNAIDHGHQPPLPDTCLECFRRAYGTAFFIMYDPNPLLNSFIFEIAARGNHLEFCKKLYDESTIAMALNIIEMEPNLSTFHRKFIDYYKESILDSKTLHNFFPLEAEPVKVQPISEPEPLPVAATPSEPEPSVAPPPVSRRGRKARTLFKERETEEKWARFFIHYIEQKGITDKKVTSTNVEDPISIVMACLCRYWKEEASDSLSSKKAPAPSCLRFLQSIGQINFTVSPNSWTSHFAEYREDASKDESEYKALKRAIQDWGM